MTALVYTMMSYDILQQGKKIVNFGNMNNKANDCIIICNIHVATVQQSHTSWSG